LSRFARVIVHNWPLKLAATGLAVLLYGGVVLSQNTQTFSGAIPVNKVGQPSGTVLLSPIPPVTLVRYFAPPDVNPVTSTFIATVDLSGVDPRAGTTSVAVTVRSVDPRINVLGSDPAFVSIRLERLTFKTVPVKVSLGPLPSGLDLGETTVEPRTATVSGPESAVVQVAAVRADVVIDSGGLDFDQDVPLIPVDGVGNAVRPIEVSPVSARVTIPVFTDRQSRSLPVTPVLTGTPAAGFEIAAVAVDPVVVTVEGDADQLAQLTNLDTQAVSVAGASANVSETVGLDLPTGVVPLRTDTVRVTVTLRQVTASRTFDAGLRLIGAKPGLSYSLSTDRVLLTIGGSTADLDRLTGATIVGDLDVSELAAGGSADVPVSVELPTGLTLVASSPATVTVDAAVPPSATPSASPGPSPSPSGG
jgi:YbbR domain-containing protein